MQCKREQTRQHAVS